MSDIWRRQGGTTVRARHGEAGRAAVQQQQQQQRRGAGTGQRASIEDQLAAYRRSGLSCELESLIRNILLSPGRISVPWEISMRIRGKRKSSEIIPIMQMLDDEGFGTLVCLQLTVTGRPRRVFIKKRAEEIRDRLTMCSISVAEYKQRYEQSVEKHEKTYRAARMLMVQRERWESGGQGVVVSAD